MPRSKAPKIPAFCEAKVKEGFSRPTDIKAEYERLYPKQKIRSLDAYMKACKRAGLTKDIRDQTAQDTIRKKEGVHILDYPEIAKYELNAKISGVQMMQVNRQKQCITTVWELMGRTDPHTWTYEGVIEGISKKYPAAPDEHDRVVFQKKGAVSKLLSAVNTFYPTILPKGWYTAFTREAGALKDYFTFAEFDLFIANLTDTEGLSLEGWRALFKAQINLGCREGSLGRTGILALQWENIDYSAKRCSLNEKGGKGKAGRLWKHLPLDMFPWLNGWQDLMLYHIKRFGYEPSNDRHETGKCFDVSYSVYCDQFTRTRKACNGRIAGDKETMRPHILRKSHAQWLVKLWVPIEQICGQFPDGYFGVGWDNPQILMKYYITLESEQRDLAMKTAGQRMIKLGVIEGEVERDAKDVLIEKLTQQVTALTEKLTAFITNGGNGGPTIPAQGGP